MQDKHISEVSEVDLKKQAYELAVGLIYRSQNTDCTAIHQRAIHEPTKQSVVLADHNLGKRIDQFRVERLLKSYSELARDEI